MQKDRHQFSGGGFFLHVTFRQAGSLSVVEATLRQLDYMHDDVTGSLSAVEVCLISATCMKNRTLRRCSGILDLAYGPFDFTAFRSGILGESD